MSQQTSLKVLEICRVAPIPEKPISAVVATSFSFTIFEKNWVRFPPVDHVSFYEFPHPPSSFFNSVLPKLKHTLSLTLHNFLPLAGNITWPLHSPKPILTYNSGDSVSFIVAESDSNNFKHLSGSASDAAFSKAEETRLLIPQLTNSDEQSSVIAFQVTLFPNSGFTLGVSAHHGVLDGQSGNLFIKAWSYICSSSSSSSSSLPENLTPFFDRPKVVKELSDKYENSWLQGGTNDRSLKIIQKGMGDPANLVRGTFELSPSSILNLKKFAESKLNKKEEAHISTFSVACGYVLECLVKAEKTEQDRAIVGILVDCRSRLDPPLPPTCLGNYLDSTHFVCETKSLLGDDGLVSGVKGITEALKKFEKGEISLIKGINPPIEMFEDPNLRTFTVAGSPRLGLYGNDFGWGRPKKVEIVSIDDTGAFSILESSSGNGGIEIGLALKEPVMKTFASIFLKGKI